MSKGMYFGVDGKARKVKQAYIGVGGTARKVKKVYVGVDGKARLAWTAGVAVGDLPVGSVVQLNEAGALTDYIVVHQGLPSSLYDASCDGTWLLRKDIFESKQWNVSNDNRYAKSDIHSYLNSTFVARFESSIQSEIKQVKIPYGAGEGMHSSFTGSYGLSAKVFFLAGNEVGVTNNLLAEDGACLAYFQGTAPTDIKRIAYLNKYANQWWLRSPYTGNALKAWYVNSTGGCANGNCTGGHGVRPALVLPSTLMIAQDGTVVA